MQCSPSEDVLPRLNLFAEVLAAKQLPPSLELIANLLETLNCISQSAPDAQADMSYIAQLLMSAIGNAANKITVGRHIDVYYLDNDFLCRKRRTSHQVRYGWKY